MRLANKHVKHCRKTAHLFSSHHLYSAQIAYHVINDSHVMNFSSVISYLLSYIGAIKTENPVPDNVSIPNLLKFLNQLIGKDIMIPYHIKMLTCFLIRPNSRLKAFHEHRMSLLETCFMQEMKSVDIYRDMLQYLNLCFIKISEYFVPLDMLITRKLTVEYLIPHISADNSDTFIINVLTYMDMIKHERTVSTTSDVASSIILLSLIFQLCDMRISTSQILLNFIELDNPKFRFCSDEKDTLASTLKKILVGSG